MNPLASKFTRLIFPAVVLDLDLQGHVSPKPAPPFFFLLHLLVGDDDFSQLSSRELQRGTDPEVLLEALPETVHVVGQCCRKG